MRHTMLVIGKRALLKGAAMRGLESIADWEVRAEAAGYRARQFAATCHVTPRHLRRFFVSRFGVPTQHWLNELRLREAARLLREQEADVKDIKDIAYLLNFKSLPHFYHQFKAAFGQPPWQFRKTSLARKRQAAASPALPRFSSRQRERTVRRECWPAAKPNAAQGARQMSVSDNKCPCQTIQIGCAAAVNVFQCVREGQSGR